MSDDALTRRARIRQLNDAFRSTFCGGRVLITGGVGSLPPAEKDELFAKVQCFSAFDRENDPHGEHDFLDLEHNGQRYFAKIDYYAPDMQGGSEDPSDQTKTTRVLTIMRTEEY